MGTRPAVSYANIFMARRIDEKITALATQLNEENNPLLCLKRFLEDIFTIYTGTLDKLHQFLTELNNTSLAAPGALAHRLQRCSVCNTSPPALSKMADGVPK